MSVNASSAMQEKEESDMDRCAHCGNTKFGLVSYRILTFNGYLVFCTKKCQNDYRKEIMEMMHKRDFYKWLANEKNKA